MSLRHSSRLGLNLEFAIASIVFVIVCFYTYVNFFENPYRGFLFSPQGEITTLFVQPTSGESLQLGDYLVKVDTKTWSELRNNIRQEIFANYRTGDPLSLVIRRNVQEISITWVFPGPNPNEIIYRLGNSWWLPFVFWLAGAAGLQLMRPKGLQSRLLAAMNFMIAIWLAAGFVSGTHESGSTFVLGVTSWALVPVSWHLHWSFPRSLARLPNVVWGLLYLAVAVMVVTTWSSEFPIFSYYLAIILAAAGSLALLIAHLVLQPRQRRQVFALLSGVGIAVIPGVILIFLRLVNMSADFLNQISIFALLFIPVSYFYTIYRRQLGGVELRANRLFSLLVYMIVLLTVSSFIAILADHYLPGTHSAVLIGAFLALLAGFTTALTYPSFERWIERHLLGMPIPPTKLVEAYTTRITTSLEMDRLVHLIRDEVLPSLLIRQAALLRLGEGQAGPESSDKEQVLHLGSPPSSNAQAFTPIFELNIKTSQLPRVEAIPGLLAEAGAMRPMQMDEEKTIPCPWVRLVLTLSVEGQPVGLFLFGRRDPDDIYAATEIPSLQALADQTALALVNIEQAARLHALYQADIERQEAESNRLASELHDGVLGQLAMLALNMDEGPASQQFSDAYQTTVQRIREIISGLRPALLEFGLPSALEELVDETSQRVPDSPQIELDQKPSEARYPPEVELHLYRIVQQACQNAVQHAEARRISIYARFEPQDIELRVEDDGKGFAAGENPDLSGLLAKRQYGLVTMHERAALIGASIQITSTPGHGTQVQLAWRENRHVLANGREVV